MSTSIKDYRNMVDQPWGRMFYELIFRQLNIPSDKRLKILDFGAGFCITADHFAEKHEVTAVEPNEEMRSVRIQNDNYTLIPQGIEYLETVEENLYDIVFCHNVLEYVDDKETILKQLERVLKPEGILSIIKHNVYGRAIAFAVFGDNPKAALDMLGEDNAEDSMFGNRDIYSNEYLIDSLSDKMFLAEIYGIRAFFGLSKNNEIKYTEEWYKSMLELEMKAGTMEEYKKIAFFNHLIFKKRTK